MSPDQTHPGSPVDSLESGGAAGVRDEAGDARCGTADACGSCSLARADGCGSVPQGTAGEPTAPAVITWREAVSARLAVIPPVAIAAMVVGLVFVGLLLRGLLGAAMLGLGVAALLGLSCLTWPRLTTPEKALRIALLVFVLGLAAITFIPN